MMTLCSYCGQPYGGRKPGKGVSHGFCPTCLPGVMREVDRLIAGKPEPGISWGDIAGYGLCAVMLIYFCGRAALTIWGGL